MIKKFLQKGLRCLLNRLPFKGFVFGFVACCAMLSMPDSFGQCTGTIVSTASATICSGNTASLGATPNAGGSIKWYTQAVGGTSVGNGNIYTTPVLNSTTNYYAEVSNISSAGSVGPSYSTGSSSTIPGVVGPNNNGQGEIFSALANIVLDSVGVWLGNVSIDTTLTVQLLSSANVVLQTAVIPLTAQTHSPAVKTYLPLNFSIPTGTGYRLIALNTNNRITLGRQSGGASGYSYSNAAVSVTNSIIMPSTSSTSNYYYFYNFYVSAGCVNTTRQMVTATVTPSPTVNLGNDTTICPSVSYTFNAGNAGAAYLWSPGGQTTQTINTNAVGQYIVNVTVNGCSKKDTIVVTPGIAPVNNLSDSVNLCVGSETTLNAGNAGSSFVWTPGGATTQTVTVSAGGAHSVVIKSADGCKITSSAYVKMRPLPINNLGNDTSICESATIVLDAGNAGYNYSWNTGAASQTINASDSGKYIVTVTTPYACVSKDSIHIAFLPSARTEGFNFIPEFFDELGRVAFSPLNPTNVNAYEWDFGDGTPLAAAMNPVHIYSANGEYNVTLKVYNDCSDFSVSQKINVDLPTGVAIINNNSSGFDIYPNPAKYVLNISNKNDYEMQDVMIFNAIGAVVYHHKADSKTMHQLSVEGFSSGVYFVRILTDKGFVNKQMQVTK